MQLIIDANVLFAALIRDSFTRRLLLDSRLRILCPEHLLSETSKHIKEDDEVRGKILLKDSEVDELLSYILKNMEVISKDTYSNFIQEASKLAPHEKDIPYFALALYLNCPIWSEEKSFKKQSKVKVYSTSDLAKEFGL